MRGFVGLLGRREWEEESWLWDSFTVLHSSLSSSRSDVKLIDDVLHAIVAREDDRKIWAEIYEVPARNRPLPHVGFV